MSKNSGGASDTASCMFVIVTFLMTSKFFEVKIRPASRSASILLQAKRLVERYVDQVVIDAHGSAPEDSLPIRPISLVVGLSLPTLPLQLARSSPLLTPGHRHVVSGGGTQIEYQTYPYAVALSPKGRRTGHEYSRTSRTHILGCGALVSGRSGGPSFGCGRREANSNGHHSSGALRHTGGQGCTFAVAAEAEVVRVTITEFADGRIVTHDIADLTLSSVDTGKSFVHCSRFTVTERPSSVEGEIVIETSGQLFMRSHFPSGPFGTGH